MNARLEPSILIGTTEAQSLKSLAMRYFTLASIAEGKTEIYLKNETEDLFALKDALSDLGVYYSRDKSVYTVTPPEKFENFYMRFSVKDSISALRFLLPVMITKCSRIEVSGTGKLTKKDVATGMETLKGVVFDSKTLPAFVSGELKVGEYVVSDTNSQLISGLLIALPLLNGDSKITFLEKPKKQTSILLDMTVFAMKEFGVSVNKTDKGYDIKGGQKYIAPKYQLVVEGDYSTAGYFLGANLIGASVQVENLSETSIQAERAITSYLEQISNGKKEIELKGKTGWVFLLTALACKLDRTTTFTNVKIKDKDKDKFLDFIRTLNLLGATITLNDTVLTVQGKSKLSGGIMLDTMGDAKVAMSYIILSSALDSAVTILSVEAGMSEQSSFLNEYIRLGGKCTVI